MVAIVTSSGLGLYNSSLNLLGSGSPAGGQSGLGRLGERLYVNSANGNLIVQQQDEYLASIGVDLGLTRTYNSQGNFDGDNNDGWRLGVYRSLYNLIGTANSAGSSITKVYGDGHEVVFAYDVTSGRYLSSEGEGAHDTLSYNISTEEWTWTDGSPNVEEIYNNVGQLTRLRDADGNTTTYSYTGSFLTRVIDASGQTTYLDYAGSNLTQIRTQTPEGTQTKVRYTYDSLNRLSQVLVDLSPANGVVPYQDQNGDGIFESVNNEVYVTTYTYDGVSTRIASITSGDGTRLAITYVLVGTEYRAETLTDG